MQDKQSSSWFTVFFAFGLFLVLVFGCGWMAVRAWLGPILFPPTATPIPPTATPLPPTATQTLTPSPTFTRTPTPTRTPNQTATAQRLFQQQETQAVEATAIAWRALSASAAGVCLGETIAEAQPYQSGAGPHPVLSCTEGGIICSTLPDSWVYIPPEVDAAAWSPQSLQDLQLVICPKLTMVDVGQCNYYDTSTQKLAGVIKLQRVRVDYQVIEARSGRKLAVFSKTGPQPDRQQCPPTVNLNNPLESNSLTYGINGGYPAFEAYQALRDLLELPSP